MRIGFDYGGTKIAGIALAADGSELATARASTPRNDYHAGIEALRDMTGALEQDAGQKAVSVGIGVPGSVDRDTGRISLGNSVWLNGRDLRGDLGTAIKRPVKVANDANCFALSEAVDGAGAGADVVFGVILGTGVGGGLVVHGRLVEGANAIGGEWGHNQLPDPGEDERPGPQCSCGGFGHNEAWLSGPGLASDHARAIGVKPGDGPTAPEIAALASGGDTDAIATFLRFENRLGRALAAIINIIDPDVIVLGGGLSNVARIYQNIPAEVKRHVFGDSFNTRLLQNVHGDSSGVRGAAWL